MKRPSLADLSLPLLEKELIEQAARKRTYVVRVAYAALLFFVACLFLYETLRAIATSPLAILGRGRDMFNVLVYLQFAGVYLFMPAITCGVLTQEKERDSLQLLLITRLGPWTILFEKLLGRLVPMLGFLLLSLPLLGFAYSLGGISQKLLWSGVWMLALAALQMGTLALACSAFFRTTVASFIATYVIAFLMFFGPYVLWMVLYLIGYLAGINFDTLMRSLGTSITPGVFILGAFPFFGPPFFVVLSSFPGGLGSWALVGHSAFILTASGVCLKLARTSVVSRAFLPPQNLLLDFFRYLDKKPSRGPAAGAARTTATDPALLPADEPIAWREMTKRSLGRPRYLFRILLLTEVPLLMFCGFLVASEMLTSDPYSFVPRVLMGLTMALAWALAVLIVSVQAASLIAGERSHQTLDVLSTTPLTGREIVLQKFRGVRRLIVVLAAPFFTITVAEACLRGSAAGRHHVNAISENFNPGLYFACSGLMVAIYLPLVAWMSLVIGLKMRTQARAMIGSMAAIVGWGALPFFVVVMPLAILSGDASAAEPIVTCAMLLSPVTFLFWNESQIDILSQKFGEYVWLPFALNFAGYGAALAVFRAIALRNADRWLGRTRGLGSTD